MKTPPRLKKLYAEMYEHTRSNCLQNCKSLAPHRCCSPEYGQMAVQVAQHFEETLPSETGHPICQFMGASGCILEQHQRPLCTLHACCINSLGFKPGDPAWTEKYFKIRNKIDRLEEKLPIPVWFEQPIS